MNKMDRLLTQEEQYEAEHEWLFEWSDIPQEYKRDLLKAQDAKTASLVAHEIRQQIHYSHQAFTDKYDYEGLNPEVYKFVSGLFSQLEQAIKSKWGIE